MELIRVRRDAHPSRAGRLVAAAVMAGAAAAACGSSGTGTASGSSAPVSGAQPPGATAPAGVAGSCPAVADGLTGLGASRTSWDAAHAVDPAVPGAYMSLGAGRDRYTEVAFACEHLDWVVLHLDSGTSEADARAAGAALLPADATLVFENKKYAKPNAKPDDRCDLLQYQSATVRKLVGKDDPDGVIKFELSTEIPNSGITPYDPHNVNTVAVESVGTLNFQDAEC